MGEKNSNAGRKKLPANLQIKSQPIYINADEKALILEEHGSIKGWVKKEVARLQKKYSKKVA